MEFFLDIFNIKNWKDFTIFLVDYNNENENIKLLLFSSLLKLYPNDIFYSSILIQFCKQYFIKLNLCNIKSTNDDIINIIKNLSNKYSNNKNEPLIFEKFNV